LYFLQERAQRTIEPDMRSLQGNRPNADLRTEKPVMASIFFCLTHFWSYANSIETAVLLVIVYDVLWHRLNAVREIKRDEDSETRAIEREAALEKRNIRRERQEFVRRHWQELQSNLIYLNRVASQLQQQRKYVNENRNSDNPTIRQVMLTIANGTPEIVSEFGDRWGRIVAQLNVFPEPRDVLALQVLKVIQDLGETVGDQNIEVKDETLRALADLVKPVAEKAILPTPED
jgi:hypothetical protein